MNATVILSLHCFSVFTLSPKLYKLLQCKCFSTITGYFCKVECAAETATDIYVFHTTGADYSRAYIDVKDAQWVCRGELKPVDINSITPSQFVTYRFGVFITRYLAQTIRTPDVTLLLASNLPPNNYDRNCFRNSFFYEHKRKVLFVRHERIDSIGDFILLVVHCLAHISTKDLKDDANPLFLRQFYKVGQYVSAFCFLSIITLSILVGIYKYTLVHVLDKDM